MSDASQNQQQQQHPTLKTTKEDLASLSRVSHRLAMVDNAEKLQQVLDKLLPRLLNRIGENNKAKLLLLHSEDKNLQDALSKIHAKLVEILSHTMKRVRGDKEVKLPCLAILELLLERKEDNSTKKMHLTAKRVDPFTANLAITFMTLGLPRCDNSDLEDMLPGLLVLNGYYTCRSDVLQSPSIKTQWHQLSHLLFRAMESIIIFDEENFKQRPKYPLSTMSSPSSKMHSSSKRQKATTERKSSEIPNSEKPQEQNTQQQQQPKYEDKMKRVREVLQDPQTCRACYDFILDIILYQTVPGNVPPPGLSQASHERLKSGYSLTERDWGAEMSKRTRLSAAKTRFLDWVSSSRRWGLFLGSTTTTTVSIADVVTSAGAAVESNNPDEGNDRKTEEMNMTRTVALLIAASGDPTPEVSDKAKIYLKQHLESKRNTTVNSRELFGDAMALIQELLTLCVGESNAALALSSISSQMSTSVLPSLGVQNNTHLQKSQGDASNEQQQQQRRMLAFRRRMISDSTFGEMLVYVSKVLEESPRLSSSALLDTTVTRIIGTLCLLAASKKLSTLRTSTGLTALRGKPYVASAKLLNSFVIRLSKVPYYHSEIDDDDNDCDNKELEEQRQKSNKAIASLLAKSLAVASEGLRPSSTPTTTATASSNSSLQPSSSVVGSEGNTSVRDALYGVIGAVCRSSHCKHGDISWLFELGQIKKQDEGSNGTLISAASTETAALLFGCISNEVETLRPRAVAALDALLAAYCRDIENAADKNKAAKAAVTPSQPATADDGDDGDVTMTDATPIPSNNPWAVVEATKGETTKGETKSTNDTKDTGKASNKSNNIQRQQSLGQKLTPLLWSAGQPSKTKQSRLAAAQWCSQLLTRLNLTGACHLLCFLTGDRDETVASAAASGLGVKRDAGNGDANAFTPSSSSRARGQSNSNNNNNSVNNVRTNDNEDDDDGDDDLNLPGFMEITTLLFSEPQHSMGSSQRPGYWEFTPSGKVSTLRYLLRCFMNDLYGGENSAMQIYVAAITKTLDDISDQGREFTELMDECAISLLVCLSTSSFARTLIRDKQKQQQQQQEQQSSVGVSIGLEELLDTSLTIRSSKARRYLAESCGHMYSDMELWKVSNDGDNSDDWGQSVISSMKRCLAIIGYGASTNNSSTGQIHGASFLAGTTISVWRLLSSSFSSSDDHNKLEDGWSTANELLYSLGRGVLRTDDYLGNAFADGLKIALSFDVKNGVSKDAPVLDDRLFGGSAEALANLTAGLRKYGTNSDSADASRAVKLIRSAGTCLAATTSGSGSIASTTAVPSQRQQAATTSTAATEPRSLGPARLDCVKILFNLLGSPCNKADDEIALVTGEALALYADAYSPKDVVWSSENAEGTDENWPSGLDEEYGRTLPPHQQAIYMLLRLAKATSNPQRRTACAPALLALVARAARTVNVTPECSHRSLVKELCLHLDEVQTCFITLLADPKSKQLARESCCLGLAACRSLANIVNTSGDNTVTTNSSDSLNDKLLRAFGQTSNYGGSAMQETRAQADSRRRTEGMESNETATTGDGATGGGAQAEVGGAVGVGEAALGAYREMAGAAMALGRPDLLYSLLMFSVSHPAWSTEEGRDRYSPTLLLGEAGLLESNDNVSEMRRALRPHLGKLLPRVLRACHDPNQQTREQMTSLWNGLTGGGATSREAITEHLLTIVDALIEDTSNRLWRARVGACTALTQVIVGRSWKALGGGSAILGDDEVFEKTSTQATTAGTRLLRLWRVSMRALDDIRISVREAGETLARGVRSLTICLCDPTARGDSKNEDFAAVDVDLRMHDKDASAAAATTLRWLIKHGLNQSCAEAAGVCISCLIGIVDVAKPAILQPIIPELFRALLLAMSSLEPAALNYLQVRAAGRSDAGESYDRLERLRLQAVQSGPFATAVTKCLDMIPSVSSEIQRAVVPQLDSALRLSAGIATRTAVADCVATLCNSCPNAFKSDGPSKTNPSVSLLRALYYASERERGQAVKDRLLHALGMLAALCPGQSVRSLAVRACEKYKNSFGANDDPAARKVGALAIRSIAVKASNQFADGGASDVWCRLVLPVSFLGMRDTDPKVASLWKEVWEEGGSVANLTGDGGDFGSLLQEKLLMQLVRECVKALENVSWSRRAIGATALGELADISILSPAPSSLNNSNTKRSSIAQSGDNRARKRVKASSVALNSLTDLLAVARLWSGKAEVAKAAVKIAAKWTHTEEETPLMVEAKDYDEGDLFVSDGWFKRTVEESMDADDNDEPMEQEKGNDGAEMEVDTDVDGIASDDQQDTDMLVDEEELDEVPTEEPTNTVDARVRTLTYIGLCRVLLRQAFPTSRAVMSVSEEEVLPFRAVALKSLADLIKILDGTVSENSNTLREKIFVHASSVLIPVIDASIGPEQETNNKKKEAPLLVARAIDALSSCFWVGMEAQQEGISNQHLLKLFEKNGGKKQVAWTVRESAAMGSAKLALKSKPSFFRERGTVPAFVNCVSQALEDRKFWKVRFAGLTLLQALVERGGVAPYDKTRKRLLASTTTTAEETQLVLESILPWKEKIVSLAKQSLKDPESKVTALASSILSTISWWP